MNIKDFFKLNWSTFILFIIFNLIAEGGIFQLGGIAGKSVGAGIFNIFSFFNQFTCATPWTIACVIWDPFIKLVVLILNIIWQFLLANLVMIAYYKIRNK